MARNWHIKGENIAEGPEKEDDFMMRDTGCPSKGVERGATGREPGTPGVPDRRINAVKIPDHAITCVSFCVF